MNTVNKIAKAILIVLAAVLVAVLIAAVVLVIYTNSDWPAAGETTAFSENWMANVKDDTLVKNIAMPGSHDAGTYTLSWLGKTQDQDIETQLKMGVRYFDLRVQQDGNGNLYIFHSSLKGTEFKPILLAFRDFLKTHSTETLILDFQHFKNGSFDAVKQLIYEFLAESNTSNPTYLVRKSSSDTDAKFISELKLSSARGKAIVFWGSDSDSNLQENYIFKRADDTGGRLGPALYSYYESNLNKLSSADYIAKGLPTYIAKFKQKNSGIFVLQGQLTDGLLLLGPQFKERTHYENMNNYVLALASTDNLPYINVIMRDFVNCEKCAGIIKLNLDKNTVKATEISGFVEGVNQLGNLNVSADIYTIPAES